MQIEVRNIHPFRGHEGEPLGQGTLYINGVNRGFVSDDSHGGPFRIDDRKARDEVTAYAKQFPDEFDFEQGERLVQTIMLRAMEAKRLGSKFDKSLCFVDDKGKVAMTKSIKGDVVKTRAAWMADPKTIKQLKVSRFITDKNEFLQLYFVEAELTHPALNVIKVKATVQPGVPAFVERVEEVKKVEAPVVPVQKFSAEKSKIELARDVYNDPANINKSRGELIKMFVAVAGCTPAGAATYYQKLKTS